MFDKCLGDKLQIAMIIISFGRYRKEQKGEERVSEGEGDNERTRKYRLKTTQKKIRRKRVVSLRLD